MSVTILNKNDAIEVGKYWFTANVFCFGVNYNLKVPDLNVMGVIDCIFCLGFY